MMNVIWAIDSRDTPLAITLWLSMLVEGFQRRSPLRFIEGNIHPEIFP